MFSRDTNISVVLCRVRESGNVGSICRAMKTMGFQNLILADCPEYQEEKVRMMAVHAYDLFEKAKRISTLEEALGEFSLSAGFSRRRGERRKNASVSLRDFAENAAARSATPLAIVFGNESDGLSDKELALCSLSVHIPSSEACPSLNVAQAVQVACYELSSMAMRRPSGARKTSDGAFAPRLAIEAEISTIADALAKAGFFRKSDDTYMKRFLRDLCERAGASPSEIAYMRKLFLKLAALASGSSPRRRGSP